MSNKDFKTIIKIIENLARVAAWNAQQFEHTVDLHRPPQHLLVRVSFDFHFGRL